MKNIFIIAAGVLLITACEKSNEKTTSAQPVTPGKTIAAQERIIIDAAANNPDNPYDSLGYWHNQGLDFVKAFMAGRTDSTTGIRLGVIEFSKKYLHIDASENKLAENTVRVLTDAKDDYTHIIDQTPYPDNVKTYLHQLVNIVKEAGDNNITDYKIVKASIMQLETQVLNDKTLNETAYKVILGTASVGRFSLYYWFHDASLTSTTPDNARQFNILRSFLIGLADIAGFATSAAVYGDGRGLHGAVSDAVDVSADGRDLLVDASVYIDWFK